MYIRWRVKERAASSGRALIAELVEARREPTRGGRPRPRMLCYLGSIQVQCAEPVAKDAPGWSRYAGARGRFWLRALAAMEERGLDPDAIEMDVVEMLERRVPLATPAEVSWYRHVQNRVLAAEKSEKRDERGTMLFIEVLELRETHDEWQARLARERNEP